MRSLFLLLGSTSLPPYYLASICTGGKRISLYWNAVYLMPYHLIIGISMFGEKYFIPGLVAILLYNG